MNDPFRKYWNDPNIFESICRKYIIASVLYYQHDFSPVEDSRYDNWALTLRMKYKELPRWFTERVSYADLAAGTGYNIKPTPEEVAICHQYLTGQINHKTTF